MDPHSFVARAEAQRWLGIAEKLLAGRDLLGSKTFAIRARESDPRLESAAQILAVADTLLAAEKRVGPANNQPDWYAILQLLQLTQDSDLIAGQYRRLALLLNPQQNFFPFADQAYQLVSDAWSVLSNPMKKNSYDNELNFAQIGFNQHHQQQQQHPQQQHHFFPDPDGQWADEQSFPPTGSNREQQQQPQWKPNPPPSQPEQPPPPPQRNSSKKPRESNFWTACPYCYNMYEYQGLYEDCTLRCVNCKRAFQAVEIPAPPVAVEGKEAYYFGCWGYFPLGISMAHLEKRNERGKGSSWAPFSRFYGV